MKRKGMQDPLRKEAEAELSVLLEFLERTREGKYATIEKSSIPYARLQLVTDDIDSDTECHFHYGMS